MRRTFQLLTLLALCILIIFGSFITVTSDEAAKEIEKDELTTVKNENVFSEVSYVPMSTITAVVIEESEEDEEPIMSQEDIELIALVTMAEAEGECEEGKRLVIDTILNRVDSEHFPNTVYDVVYQPSQFSSMWNGRVDRCEVRDDICQLVLEELESRYNYDVIFFTAGKYSAYGVPLFQVENHYFSSYD